MWRWATLLCLGLVGPGCDEPDEIFHPLPRGIDPSYLNGNAPVGSHFEGEHPFVDTAPEGPTGPSVEVCTDAEISERWAAMVSEPVIPLVGAAGLDMRGQDWAGLTIDEAQQRDKLCQAIYYDAEGVAAWGDYYEVIAFFDPTTRAIEDILVTPGYLGTIEAGDWVFEINEPIRRAGVELARGDGGDRDPKTADNLREMDRALVRAFRPGLDADLLDCVETGSCYVISSGTVPFLVFTSVDVYIPLEPSSQRIVQLETALKRPFRIGTGTFDATSIAPTIRGTAAGGIADCEVTFGTDWAEIERDCLGDDPLQMAQITPALGYEQVLVQMGGILLYLERPSLGNEEILPYDPVPQAGDTVALISVNAGYEGQVAMPYSDFLRIYRANLDAAIRAEVPELLPEDPTGAELLRTPDDPDLPASVQGSYPDRMRPGGLYAAFCEPDGDDVGTEYDLCYADDSGRETLPLTFASSQFVTTTLGALSTPKLSDSAFYVQEVHRALGEQMNGGPLGDEQIVYAADDGSPDRIYSTVGLLVDGEPYTFNAYYGGNDDRLHFMNFQQGGTRMEEVLLLDAALPTPADPYPSGVFTLEHLLGSPRIGVGSVGGVLVNEIRPETRRAFLTVAMDGGQAQVLAPFTPASNVSGYWIPREGPHDQFQSADWFHLYGNSMDVEFYMVPALDDPELSEVVALGSTQFFGDATFCGVPVRIGDFAADLLDELASLGYPCRLDVREADNREFITAIADMDSQMSLSIANDQVTRVFAWVR